MYSPNTQDIKLPYIHNINLKLTYESDAIAIDPQNLPDKGFV